ncbi:MAG: 30S ribosomal protein S6 [Candidatus Brocadiia bacterium]|nr:30S ribosomal protein S6 [Planctomycetota bacterium]
MKDQLYEAMFLADAAKGGSELPALIRHISGLLTREEATIERIEKWAERKLAYRIKRVDRGIYVLVYFRADPARVEPLRRAINLSEEILRVLILKIDEVPPPEGDIYNPEGELQEESAEEKSPEPTPIDEEEKEKEIEEEDEEQEETVTAEAEENEEL